MSSENEKGFWGILWNILKFILFLPYWIGVAILKGFLKIIEVIEYFIN